MQIDVLLAAATASTRKVKEAITEDGPADIHPIIEVWRGIEPIALVTLLHHDRDEILHTAAVCAGGMDADAMAISFEGYAGVGTAFRSPNINPITGRQWGDSEMQEVVEKHDGLAQRLVTEMICINVVNRAGDLAALYQPFSYVDQKIAWGQAKDMSTINPDWTARGRMPEAMVKMMLAPSGSIVLPYGDNTSLERTRRDAVCAQYLTSERCQVALWARGDDQERIDFIRTLGTIIE